MMEAMILGLKAIAVGGGALAALAVAAPQAAQQPALSAISAPEIQFTQWAFANGG